jgi:signal transduction histidine kinase
MSQMKLQSKRSAGTAELLQSFFEATAPAIGDDFFCALVRHLAITLEVRQAFISEVTENPIKARTLAIWYDGQFIENLEYDLPGTPCELVLNGEIIQIQGNFKKIYPRDEGLAGMPVESYLGVPLIGESGKILGHVVAMDDKPMTEKSRDFSTFEIFAARATAELERRRTDQSLRHRVEMEKLLARISASFINISPNQIDNSIEKALSLIGTFSKVDRSYIFIFSEDRKTISNTHEWCSEGIESRRASLQKIPTDEINWIIEKLQRNEVTHIPNLNVLPPDSLELKKYFQSQKIRSFLEVPLISGNQLTGILGFNTSRFEKEWSEDDIRILRIAGETFTNALERKRADQILKKTQAQLLQSEKMASLGKLTAGIAHELNSPIGAVGSAVESSAQGLENVIKILKTKQISGNIKSLQRTLIVLQNNVQILATAGNRLVELVTHLKKFTGLDEAEFQKVDIHERIDSTLALIKYDMKDRIRLKKEYGNIPEVYCMANEINQVFMIVLTNSVQAIENEGTITIKTTQKDSVINIEISDTGRGMTQEKLNTLLDFDFTTKSDRISLGMGLMSAYNIIKKHKGQIEIKSEAGKGTSVAITLPTNIQI